MQTALALLSVAPHPALPAIDPGVVITLAGSDHLLFTVRATPSLLRRVAEAIRDGALIPQGGNGMPFEEIEAHVQAHHTALIERINAALAELERSRYEPADRLSA